MREFGMGDAKMGEEEVYLNGTRGVQKWEALSRVGLSAECGPSWGLEAIVLFEPLIAKPLKPSHQPDELVSARYQGTQAQCSLFPASFCQRGKHTPFERLSGPALRC
jgi:hypothetical protein